MNPPAGWHVRLIHRSTFAVIDAVSTPPDPGSHMSAGKRIGFGMLGALVGYVMGAFSGYWLIAWFSSGFDRSVEAAMTAVFACGPLGALGGLIFGIIRGGRRPKSAE